MKFSEKQKVNTRQQMWQEYCGFLDISIEDYMYIQNHLMTEQLRLWRNSGIGRQMLNGRQPANIRELQDMLPLTSYADYAEVLLSRKADQLPAEPVVWIQTTWEGGLRPMKLAPYTREMLDTYRHNTLAIMMLASSSAHGSFDVRPGDRILYGGAPLPYMTGLLPSLLDEEIKFHWLPDTNSHSTLSFSQRIKAGFSMAMRGGIDYFFAIGSVANYITENFHRTTGSKKKGRVDVRIALRYLKAKYICRRDGRKLLPRDLFRLKGMVATGTDAWCFKKALSDAWGVPPIEIAAGTESSCIAAETRTQDGMVFFPDACFYEFISEAEMRKNLNQPEYTPRTCLMDEVEIGERYELVISVFHGGAFMRYRIGDVFRCISAGQGRLPRFTYVDRVPSVIDIAGFTRITESSITQVIRLSKLGIGDWLARKEYDERNVPFLHLYLEMTPEAQANDAITRRVLTEHLSVYFQYFDSDYDDLKKLLGMEPLCITILRYGTIASFEGAVDRTLPRINCSQLDLADLLRRHNGSAQVGGTAL